MNVTNPLGDRREELLEEAMDWLMRLRDQPSDPDAIREWRAWLALSDGHRAAWQRACRTWQVLGDIGQEQPAIAIGAPLPEAERVPIASLRRSPPSRLRSWHALAGIAMLGAMAFLFGPTALLRLQADYMTGTGEARLVTLTDGSSVTLGPGSALAADMKDGRRHVRLLAGEAFFDVVRDEATPFVVSADDAQVTVLGTAFNVRESGEETRVELARGAVTVQAAARPSVHVELAPGDAIAVSHAGEAIRSHVDPLDIGLWREGRLAVTDQSVASVVAAIQRYHAAWIVISDRSLAAQRVTGLYDIRNPDRALAALVEPFGGKVTNVSPLLRVVSGK